MCIRDRLLISTLRDINPNLHITVIVRGKPVLNDATLEDAKYIHMEDVAQKVLGNGTGLPGNVVGAISKESMDEVCLLYTSNTGITNSCRHKT